MRLVQVKHLFFSYKTDPTFTLKINDFCIEKNSQIFIEGPSGCGKTTFLNLLTGLLKPTKGSIDVLGTNITTLSMTQCDSFRAAHFGIIFQLFNLIHYLSVIENIILPCTFSTTRKENAIQQWGTLEKAAIQLCRDLDIDNTLCKKPIQQLSIGQQQRVAIARALIGQPEIIIADEPTSALDNDRKQQFMNMLLNECQKRHTTLIFVSHDTSLKSSFEHIYHLNNLSHSTIKNVTT